MRAVGVVVTPLEAHRPTVAGISTTELADGGVHEVVEAGVERVGDEVLLAFGPRFGHDRSKLVSIRCHPIVVGRQRRLDFRRAAHPLEVTAVDKGRHEASPFTVESAN